MWAVGTFEVRSVKAASDPLSPPALTQTAHPPVSRDASALWLAPTAVELRLAASDPFITLKTAVQALKDGRGAEALRVMTPLVDGSEGAGSPLDNYVAYYAALADFGLNNLDRARDRLQALRDEPLKGYLAEAAALAEAEVAEAQSEYEDALKIYEELTHEKTSSPDAIWMKLGHAAYVTGERSRAAEAYTRVYYDFPLSDLAADARAELDRLEALEPLTPQSARYRLDLGRAERMFTARRYADAQSAYEALKLHAVGDDRDLIALRLAECDYFRGRYRQARQSLRGLIADGPREAEARYFYARALDKLHLASDSVTTARKLIDQFPDSSWAEDALNDLATGYVRQNNEAAADGALRELYAKFPAGRYAARAAWKIGWHSYRAGRYLETVSYFDLTARQFPRSDYRPAFLYWSGRAHEAMGDRATAAARYTLATADYLNTYYGRVASKRLVRRGEAVPSTGLEFISAGASPDSDRSAAPPTAQMIRSLLASGLYDEAMNELGYVQRTWDDTPITQATTAWIYSRQGNFRDAIVAMKRAYPQYMASGGELMPEAVLKVIFPLDYWSEIQAHAARHDLSPYFLAALVAQESVFDAKVRSSANAVGLMQLIPSTGRLYARRLKLGQFSTSMLTNPKTNMTMGSAYIADLMKKFGEPYLALAAYNAGDSRVARWLAERQGEGLDQEEFIDDIPFAETQSYVKKILSTAEDYRRLYGDSSRATR
jgi:soluble lytic murein transglycosylase